MITIYFVTIGHYSWSPAVDMENKADDKYGIKKAWW